VLKMPRQLAGHLKSYFFLAFLAGFFFAGILFFLALMTFRYTLIIYLYACE